MRQTSPHASAAGPILIVFVLLWTSCGKEPAPDKSRAEGTGHPSAKALRVAITDGGAPGSSTGSNRWTTVILKQICDTLVAYDPRGGGLRPGIAQSWTVSEGGKKVTFKLRGDVKFHNGRALTASDYVSSLSSFVNPKNGSAEHFLLEKVVGYPEVRSGAAATLAGVTAPDPSTLEINLREPFAELPGVLAHPLAGAAFFRSDPAERALFPSRLVCTGPYRLAGPWQRGGEIRLRRFESYYGNKGSGPATDGRPSEIIFKPSADEDSGYEMFERGEADLAPLPAERIGKKEGRGDAVSGPNGYISYIGLPVARAPFDNVGVRRALALSIDRKPILRAVAASPSSVPGGFLPRAAGPASRRGDCPDVSAPRSDPAEARSSLSSRGDGTPLRFYVYANSGGGHDRWLEPLTDQWKKTLDADPRLVYTPWRKYLESLVRPGPDGPFRLAWTVGYPSPEAVLQPLFESGSPDNFTRFSDRHFDELLQTARVTADFATRQDLYAQAARLLCAEMPLIPIWFGENHYVVAPGWQPRSGRMSDAVDVFGDPVLRDLSTD